MTLLLTTTVTNAANPAATFDKVAAQQILNEFSQYKPDFQDEFSAAPRAAIGVSPKQAEIYGRYMNKAFYNAGYSMDRTLLSYFKSDRTYPVVFFMSQLNLEQYSIFIKDDAIANAMIASGAISKETAQYARDLAPDKPVNNPDFIIKGSPDQAILGLTPTTSADNRQVGFVREGKGRWAGWLYLQSLTELSEDHGIGLTIISETSGSEMQMWNSLIDKKVKVEGRFINIKDDITTDDGKFTISNPSVYDRTRDISIKTL